MGINVGAFLAPVVAEFVHGRFGFHPAFAVAAAGMVISVAILWRFKRHVEGADTPTGAAAPAAGASALPIDAVPTRTRIAALVVVYLIVIVFWMVFHQNGSTMTYWANENTAWKVTGIISNAINPAWVILLTFPLVALWKALDRRGREPSTPVKMAIGMCLTAAAFLVLFVAARTGEATVTDGNIYHYKVSPLWLIGAYAVLTCGELMLSPMGLSLVP